MNLRFMQVEVLSEGRMSKTFTQQGAAWMKATDWVLEIWCGHLATAVVLGLMALNAYVQRIARIESGTNKTPGFRSS